MVSTSGPIVFPEKVGGPMVSWSHGPKTLYFSLISTPDSKILNVVDLSGVEILPPPLYRAIWKQGGNISRNSVDECCRRKFLRFGSDTRGFYLQYSFREWRLDPSKARLKLHSKITKFTICVTGFEKKSSNLEFIFHPNRTGGLASFGPIYKVRFLRD